MKKIALIGLIALALGACSDSEENNDTQNYSASQLQTYKAAIPKSSRLSVNAEQSLSRGGRETMCSSPSIKLVTVLLMLLATVTAKAG